MLMSISIKKKKLGAGMFRIKFFLLFLIIFPLFVLNNSHANVGIELNICDVTSSNAQVIDANDFYRNFFDDIENIYSDTTYSYVHEDGEVTEYGPFAYNIFQNAVMYYEEYSPSEFSIITIDSHDITITYGDHEEIKNTICNIIKDNLTIRDLIIKLDVLSNRDDWDAHASKFQPFPYIETGRNVIEAPKIKDLEHYVKYIAVNGVIIVGGQKVPDDAFLYAYDSVNYMLSKRPDIAEELKRNKVRISLFGPDGNNGELPEYPNSDEEGGLAMGITDSSMTANAGWLCYPGNYDIGGDPVIHELVHSIQHVVFDSTNELYFYEKIMPLAESAWERGLMKPYFDDWSGSKEEKKHAIFGEYWAMSVEGYIMNRGKRFKSTHYSRDWIKDNDPELYELITFYFPTEEWDYCPGIESML